MDNSSEVVTKIAGIYAERLMSDVILVVGKQELAAHRLILCASSEVFQIMLMSSNWTESGERKIVLKVSSRAMHALWAAVLRRQPRRPRSVRANRAAKHPAPTSSRATVASA